MIFQNTHTKVYGFLLLALPKFIKYNIISYIEPSHIIDINFEAMINELYAYKIDNDIEFDKKLKKMIVCVLTGLMEKKYNRKSVSNVFHTFEEAQQFANLYNKQVKIISNTNEDDIYTKDEKYKRLIEELNIMMNNKESLRIYKKNINNGLDMV